MISITGMVPEAWLELMDLQEKARLEREKERLEREQRKQELAKRELLKQTQVEKEET